MAGRTNMETLMQAHDDTTTIDLPRFGLFSYAQSEVLSFPWGLPGFAQLRRFIVLAVPGQDGYIWLQSLDDLKVALPLCDPWSLFDTYDATLPHYARESLAIEAADDFCILCVCVVGDGAAEMTINLLAPVVINLKSRIGRQITLENQRYAVRTPIPRMASGNVAEEVVST